MLVERREQVIAIWLRSTGNGRNPMFSGRRQPLCDGTSRISREAYVRFCERLGVKFPGSTRQSRRFGHVWYMSGLEVTPEVPRQRCGVADDFNGQRACWVRGNSPALAP